MGYIDFSNAHIECINSAAFVATNLNLFGGQYFQFDNLTNNQSIAGHNSPPLDNRANSITVHTTNITNDGFSVVYDGRMSASGNGFLIGTQTNAGFFVGWKITNVEFEAGDIYSFQINVNLNYL